MLKVSDIHSPTPFPYAGIRELIGANSDISRVDARAAVADMLARGTRQIH
jgi:hypothetical protein